MKGRGKREHGVISFHNSDRVQITVPDSASDTEPNTLDNSINKSVILCKNSDMKAPTVTPSLDEKLRMSKRKKKPPTTKNEDFLW
jgi:hypothetical protein